jgi:uncharacterized protein (TIGR00369 family)
MPTKLEDLERTMRGESPMPPIAHLVGFRLTSVKRGEVVVEFDADTSRHANPMGTLHGGVLCDIADAAMGMSYASTLEEDESFTTLELKINFLKPVWNDRLIASGHVIQRGQDGRPGGVHSYEFQGRSRRVRDQHLPDSARRHGAGALKRRFDGVAPAARTRRREPPGYDWRFVAVSGRHILHRELAIQSSEAPASGLPLVRVNPEAGASGL